MGYLKNKHNTQLIFDPTYPDIDKGDFPKYNWTEFYGDAKELMPADMPPPLGKWWWIVTMLEIDGSDNPGQASSYFVTWPLLIGYLRSNRQLKHQSLVPSSSLWSTALRNFGDWDTSVEWWGFPCLDPHMFMATTSQPLLIRQRPNQLWRRKAIPFATTPCKNLWQWVNHCWPT